MRSTDLDVLERRARRGYERSRVLRALLGVLPVALLAGVLFCLGVHPHPQLMLAVGGGVFTLGEKLFAVPWEAMTLDTINKRFTLNIDKDRIENAPGFDSDHWPNMANQTWASQIHTYYGTGSLHDAQRR